MPSLPGRPPTIIATTTTATATALAVALVGTSLTGCGLLDPSSRLEEALEYLPGDATSVTFTDTAAVERRLTFDDLETGASEEDIAKWSERHAEEGYGSELDPWVGPMQEAAFSTFDLEWEATATGEDEMVRVWKLRDDLDFDKVADDLEDAGYDRSGSEDAQVFSIDVASAGESGAYGDRYPNFLLEIALVPDEYLIVTGDVETGLDVVDDDEDSLADAGSFDDLLDQSLDQDDLEFAATSIDPACSPGGRTTPEQRKRLEETGLGVPDDGIGLFVRADERLKAVRLFADEDGATDDAEALSDHLEESAVQTGLDIDFDVAADGEAVLTEADFDDRRVVVDAWFRGAGPATCAGS